MPLRDSGMAGDAANARGHSRQVTAGGYEVPKTPRRPSAPGDLVPPAFEREKPRQRTMNNVVKKDLNSILAVCCRRASRPVTCESSEMRTADGVGATFASMPDQRLNQRGHQGLAETTQRQRPKVNFEPVQPVRCIFRKARIEDGFHRAKIVLQRARRGVLCGGRGRAGMRAKVDTDAMDEVVHVFRLRLAKAPCVARRSKDVEALVPRACKRQAVGTTAFTTPPQSANLSLHLRILLRTSLRIARSWTSPRRSRHADPLLL